MSNLTKLALIVVVALTIGVSLAAYSEIDPLIRAPIVKVGDFLGIVSIAFAVGGLILILIGYIRYGAVLLWTALLIFLIIIAYDSYILCSLLGP